MINMRLEFNICFFYLYSGIRRQLHRSPGINLNLYGKTNLNNIFLGIDPCCL